MEKVAIVGTGIAGMVSAWLLHDKYDITVFEQNEYVGGHTNTVYIEEDGAKIPIDTGFIVFNKINYPNLVRLFEKLDVPYKPTKMSFSVQHVPRGLEYSGSGFNGIFGQRKNLLSRSFYKMLMDINRFNASSVEVMDKPEYAQHTLGDFIQEKKFGKDFTENYILPMNSAIWSTPPEKSLEFPLLTMVRFFKNHGLLGVNTHFQWYTVEGGSETYKEILLRPFRDRIKTNSKIVNVERTKDKKVELTAINGEKFQFDKVILAGHADQSLSILKNPTSLESNLLEKFAYQQNQVTLHTDANVMPRRSRVWSAWNYRIEKINGHWKTSTVYDMNSLQKVSDKQNYFLSVNDAGIIHPDKILRQFSYDHPVFTVDSIEAQKELPKINQGGPVYFCGSYFGYGFHEDALKSGIQSAEQLAEKKLWN